MDVLYLISHGFSARMLIQSNLLGLLKVKGVEVGIFTPFSKDRLLTEYCQEHDIKIYSYNYKLKLIDKIYLEYRKYFLEETGKNVALIEKYKWFTKYNKDVSFLRKISHDIFFHLNLLIGRFKFIESLIVIIDNWILNKPQVNQFISELKPKLVISTYPIDFNEALILRACKNYKKSKTIIQFLSWDNITSKGRIPQLADKYFVWGNVMTKELIEYYDVKIDDIIKVGVPHFDIHIKNSRFSNSDFDIHKLGLDPSKPYIYFGMVAARFVPNEILLVEWLVKKVNEKYFGGELQLIIRPHPQNLSGNMKSLDYIERLKKLCSEYVAIDWPDVIESELQWSMESRDMERVSRLINGCLVCINSGSTLTIDALICKKPSIVIGFDFVENEDYWKSAKRGLDYIHLKKLLQTKGIKVVYSLNELTKNLKILSKKGELIPISDIEKTALEYCYTINGDSTNITVESIVKVLKAD